MQNNTLAEQAEDANVRTRGRSKSGVRLGARRIADPTMRGINRDERPKQPTDAGWRVRILQGGKYVANRHFRDQAYGGRDAALAAAKCYRDHMCAEHRVKARVSGGGPMHEIRAQIDMTQRELAGLLRVSVRTILCWEKSGAPEPITRLMEAVGTGRLGRNLRELSIPLKDARCVLQLRRDEMAMKLGRATLSYAEWERPRRAAPGWVRVYVQALLDGWNDGVQGDGELPKLLPDSSIRQEPLAA